VRKLIADSDPSVSEHFRTDSITLEYKEELATRVASYVDSIAVNMLAPEGPFEFKPQITTNESHVEIGDLDRNRRSTSGSTTVEEEPVFEDPTRLRMELLLPSHSRRPQRRHYSSSPTTSYSTDPHVEGANPAEHEENLITVSSVRVASKVAQAKPSRRIVGGKGANVRVPSKATYKSKYTSSQMAAIREAQALRYAGQDEKMPRPYIKFEDREYMRLGLEALSSDHLFMTRLRKHETSITHLDFTSEEIEFLCGIVRAIRGGIRPAKLSSANEIVSLMRHQEFRIDRICAMAKSSIKNLEDGTRLLRLRGADAIRAFLLDAAAGNVSSTPQFHGIFPSLERRPLPKPRISSLLRERQTWGMAPSRVGHGDQPLEVEFSSHLEDQLTLQSEWTDCCGDISTLSWTSDQAFICGATAHSDYHNMQYNKPGNLLVGSIPNDSLKSISDHRIIRPMVGSQENQENALESMRQTQSPWLYTSVVSTAHSDMSGHTFTASFDETVKVWRVSQDGSSMDLNATWQHDGRVNFVVTSEHHTRVATASDVVRRAIRVYNLDESSIQDSPYDIYDCDKAMAQAQEPFRRDTWAYFPASIAWGKSPGVANFLLVGYSPRSLTAHESEIPEDKRNSGEICLWNVEDGEALLITSAKTQNVFEVLWHPTQPIFLAATSPAGIYDLETKTQIRLFAQNEHGSFTHIKALDCKASDINELTIMYVGEAHCLASTNAFLQAEWHYALLRHCELYRWQLLCVGHISGRSSDSHSRPW
jgi:WD40 repeat protein